MPGYGQPTSAKLAQDLEAARRRERQELEEAAIFARTASTVLGLRERAYSDPTKAQQLCSLAQLDVVLAELELEELRRNRWADEAREEQRGIEANLSEHRAEERAMAGDEDEDTSTPRATEQQGDESPHDGVG